MKRATALLTLIAMGFFSGLFGASDSEARKLKNKQHEAETPSAEALARRAASIAFLKEKGVPTIAHLPVIEDSASARPRTPQAISERLIACTICAVGGESGDKAFVQQLLTDFAAEKLLSPKEREFVDRKLGEKQDRIQFSWRYERS